MSAQPSLANHGDDFLDERTIVPQLLEMQRLGSSFWIPNEKSLEWFEDLHCLSLKRGSKNELELSSFPDGIIECGIPYVAVSYSCEHMMDSGPEESGKYRIDDLQHGENRKSKTRNSVIDRVINWTRGSGCRYIWIAEECVEEGSKQLAMDSMDLVYGHSVAHPLGVLSTVLQDEQDLKLLQVLLSGKLVLYNKYEPPVLSAECHDDAIDLTIGVLKRLHNDRWWHRQWIFQEEYLAGKRMWLLIHYNCELKGNMPGRPTAKRSRCVDFYAIDGELCIRATRFRERTTLLLMAILNDENHEKFHEDCRILMDTFGKYNLLYKFDPSHQGRAMSSKIIADLHRRDVSRAHDLLSIAANSCNYAIRFDSSKVVVTSYSFKLQILEMCIRNGHIIAGTIRSQKTAHESVSELLDRVSFRKFNPPTEGMELTWLKDCRLKPPDQGPMFTKMGIRTRGYLWTVRDKLHTRGWLSYARFQEPRPDFGLFRFERNCLFKLLDRIRSRKGCRHLAQELWNYLEEDISGKSKGKREWPAKTYMDLMAGKVVEAIENEQPLYFAGLWGSRTSSAVFVDLRHRNTKIFTSWSSGLEEDRRPRTRYASLQVKVTPSPGPALVQFADWVNGLVFFTGKKDREVIVRWPHAWRQVEKEA